MNAEFFLLAFTAALNPKLLAIDLLLIDNRRPRAMFLCILIGGMTVGVGIGLADVLVAHPDATKTQSSASAGVDLGLGLLLLAAGLLLATGRLHGRQKAAGPAANGPPKKKTGDGWAQRALGEPRLGLALVVGAFIGLPGASYLAAMHDLITGKSSTATQVIAVIVFVAIEFLLIIIPWTFLALRPEATKLALKKAQVWISTHARQLMVAIALVLGAYLAISGLVRLI